MSSWETALIYVITMGFCAAKSWRASLAAFKTNANPNISYEHVFVDHHYPLNYIENRKEIWDICRENGVSILDPGRNLGGHAGFNYALARLPLQDNDIVLGYDPDSNPISPGFLGALTHPIEYDPKIAWTSLMSPRAKPELIDRGFTRRHIRHLELWVTHKPVVNSIVGWRYAFLKRIGGLQGTMELYGGLEATMFWRMKEMGYEWAFLPGWEENDEIRNIQDHQYLWWKWRHQHLRDWPGDFKSYIEAGCPPPRDLPEKMP